jgi:8-oxo-dGTP diphosphatase
MQQSRFKIVPASYLLLIKNNKILMSRRFNTGFCDGQYSLIAGHLEKGEGFIKAMVREAKEEANIILKSKDIAVAHVTNRYEPQNNVELSERIDVFFVAKQWRGEIKNMEPDKCDDLSWHQIDKLPINTIPFIKTAINNIRKKIFYSEFGYIKV